MHTHLTAITKSITCQLFHFTANVLPPPCDDANLEGYTLLQLGEKLDISALVKAKRYKGRGNKVAAVEACNKLQEKGFGTLLELGSSRGTPMVSNHHAIEMHIPAHCKCKYLHKLHCANQDLQSWKWLMLLLEMELAMTMILFGQEDLCAENTYLLKQ